MVAMFVKGKNISDFGAYAGKVFSFQFYYKCNPDIQM